MHFECMKCNPCSLVKCIPIECSGFHAAWLNAVDFMQHGPKHPDWMQWIPCSVFECSGFMQREEMEPYWMQWILGSMIECSGFHAVSLNAEDSMHCGAMDTNWMQWSPCSEAQCTPIECSGFYAAGPKASRLNAVDSMQRHWMQCNPCSVVKCIQI